METEKRKNNITSIIEIFIIFLIIIIAFCSGFIISRTVFLKVECKDCDISYTNTIKEIEYIKLDRMISDIVMITNVEKTDNEENYRLKGVKYVPYEISEEEFLKIQADKKYVLYGEEYEYKENIDEEGGKGVLVNKKSSIEYAITLNGVEKYSLISNETGNYLLNQTKKYIYIDIDKNIFVTNEYGEKINTVEKYFDNYSVIDVPVNENPDVKNTFYFEITEDKEGNSKCTGIINVDRKLR